MRQAQQAPGRRQATLMPTLVVAFLLAGCSTPGGGDGGAPEKLDLLALLDDTTEFQRALIEDGVVTDAELEKALLAKRDCVIEAGAVPGEIYENANGEPSFDYEIIANTVAEAEAISKVADECLTDYYADVGAVWAYQKLLTPAEREKQRPAAIACFARAGLTQLADDATIGDIIDAIRADDVVSESEQACIEQFNGLFGTWVNEPSGHDEDR